MPGAAFGFPPAFYLRPPGQFLDRSGLVSVAPSTQGVAVDFQIPESFVGIILAIGFDGGQLTGVLWATWELRVNGLPDPEFVNVQGMIARVLEPAPYYRTVQGGSRVQLVVSNTNTVNSFAYTGRVQAFVTDAQYLYAPDGLDGVNLRD